MIRKALIPVAGRGTRLYPLTRVLPKAMLPLPFGRRGLVPVVHRICAEAAAAGVRRVLIIVSPAQRAMIGRYLARASAEGPGELPAEIEMAVQAAPRGFGDAVMCGAEFIGDEPFLLMLGDHVYMAAVGRPPCAAQVLAAYEEFAGVAMIGVQAVEAGEVSDVGVAAGEPIRGGVYRCRDFVEKPDPATARRRLATAGLGEGSFLAHCGLYVFGSQIFDCLEAIRRSGTAGGEIELADAQSMLLERHPEDYRLRLIDGRAYDTGTPEGYQRAFTALADAAGFSR